MLKVTIISPGKTKEKSLQNMESKFKKLLSPYVQITWRNTAEHKIQKNQPVAIVQGKEAYDMLNALSQNDFLLALDENGTPVTSLQFSKLLERLEDEGTHVTFIIGGTFGLSKDLKARADKLLALSAMTFTHEMTRVILLEQIYRAVCLIKGKSYHY